MWPELADETLKYKFRFRRHSSLPNIQHQDFNANFRFPFIRLNRDYLLEFGLFKPKSFYNVTLTTTFTSEVQTAKTVCSPEFLAYFLNLPCYSITDQRIRKMLLRSPRRIITIRKSLVIFSCLILSVVFLQQLSFQAQTVYLNLSFNIANIVNVQSNNVEDVKYRIQLFKGKCLSSADGSVVSAMFCEPNKKQSFKTTFDGKLKFDRTGKCLQRSNISLPYPGYSLRLGDCSKAAQFDVVDGVHIRLISDIQDMPSKQLCVTPAFVNDTKQSYTIEAISSPKQGGLVSLLPCHDQYSTIYLKPEHIFMKDREALLQPPSLSDTTCDYPACAINKRAPPVKYQPLHNTAQRCKTLSDCVTVVTKTARRPHLVERLAQSFRDVKGYDLPIIAVDDGGEPYSSEVMQNLSHFKNLNYIISNDTDLGIALGRKMAVELVKTKYFFLLDDDSVVNNRTNIEQMVEILETTDAALIGGRITDSAEFAGLLRFELSNLDGKRRLTLYKNACLKLNETVEHFPNCMRCDITTNVFMARTRDILEVGGWSKELKIVEHKDLFLRLKAAQKKVVYCPDFQIFNVKQEKKERDEEYQKKRFSRFNLMKGWFNNIWTVDGTSELFFKRMSDDIQRRIENES